MSFSPFITAYFFFLAEALANFMYIKLLILHILGSFCNHSELYSDPSQAATTTSSSSKEFVASSTRLHQAHCQPFETSNLHLIEASFSGPPTPCSPSQTHYSGVSNNDGILEVQTLLEGPQREAPTLSSLRRPLEQDAGPELCATRAGAFPALRM